MRRYIALQKVVELGSFAKAAEEMGYTQSALSQTIASLEEELGIKLLTRSRTGSVLTEEGKEIYPYIEKTIFQYHASLEKAKDIRGLKTGIIRIGTISSISVNWLPAVIKKFHAKYPEVQFVLHQGDYTMIEEWIRTGQVDFGFVSSENVKGIEILPLAEGTFSAVLPEGHPLAAYEKVPLAMLAEQPFIMLEMGHHSECAHAFREAGLKPKIKYTLHDDYAIMAMVEQNMGVSILADLVMRRMSFRIVKRPVDPPMTRTISVGYRSRLELPMASKYFIRAIEEYISETNQST